MTAPFFEVHHVSKRFGGLVAVNNVSFSVGEQEIVGLIGPNGAGKTTLVRMIMGLIKPDQGSIRFKGEELTRMKTWEIVEKGVAGTFQNTRPFSRLPIIANVMVSRLGKRTAKKGEWVKSIEAKAMEALEFAGISDLALEPASHLSQGDLKRLEIARALATEPELLILDEPFGGLNPTETELLAKSIKRLKKGGRFGRLHSEGVSMIIIEHKLQELMKIVDRIIVLQYGQLIASGTPEEIVRDERVIEAYIGKGVTS
ncbi:ABC transporter related protein [Caldalkalibacillus thermarum TA2.A1]|uniref:ABC transporter ATP-binding protein n=1 Tax=Caldalkalibacillus thermarum (strain TA2.A1) TaxID=986075 RepID=F5L6S7_CALTT|nr:ABC transporter ATP-binding protein [Caldalkalibacillus thermarum]EGL82970.1 ABC transporter related protein [Caldalkalibacillus thermarum TA2.A1]QZT33591.1 ABC transporter ATP-binding protein [Caldalkalibacillus thermarum TA2.A1]